MNQWKKRLGVSLAHGFEYYDIAVYTAIQYYVAINFFPETAFGEHAGLFAWFPFILRFLARPFGGFFVGAYADRYGRRAALIFTSALTGGATLAMALLPTYDTVGLVAPCLFFIMQLLQAFCFGGENPAAMAYLLEDAKKNEQARIGGLLWGMPLVAIALSLSLIALVESFLSEAQMISYGWRIPVFIGVVNIAISYYFRIKLVESNKFSSSKKVGVDSLSAIQAFILYVPTTILFYGNSLASKSLIAEFTTDDSLRTILPIVFNLVFFIACCVLGFIIDRTIGCKKALTRIYPMVIVLSVPVYALQTIDHWLALTVSQLVITLFVATSVSATPSVIFNKTSEKYRITTMGLGINLGVVLVGAFMPMMVSILSAYNQAYVGAMMSFGGLFYFLSFLFEKRLQRKTESYANAVLN